MPLTRLDDNSALIVVDLQKALPDCRLYTLPPGSLPELPGLRGHSASGGCRSFLVNVTGRAPGRTDAGTPKLSFPPDWAEFVPELEQQPSDYVVTKQRAGAFIGTSLDKILRQLGVTQVFLTGMATSLGVESTARSAYDCGYNVVLVVDAMTDRDGDSRRHSVEKISPVWARRTLPTMC
jgi:nicotinamidase-related amidase